MGVKIRQTKARMMVWFLLLSLMLVSCAPSTDITERLPAKTSALAAEEAAASPTDTSSEKMQVAVPTEKPKDTYNILFAGDVIYHLPVVRSCFIPEIGTYDFSPPMRLIKPMVEQADLAVVNFETAINPSKEPLGFPLFNTPKEALWGLKQTGFDIINTCHNHTLDQGEQGMVNVLDAVDEFGLINIGTQREGQRRTRIVPLDDWKLGFFSYTYALNGNEWCMDADKLNSMINVINRDKIQEDIAALQEEGANFIIGIMHWGNEYSEKPSPEQQALGRDMIDWGADVIIGSHPHVVQQAEYWSSSKGQGPIIYAIGNHLSNQYADTMGNVRAEDGLMVTLTLRREGDDLALVQTAFEPTWVLRRDGYTVIPLAQYFQGELGDFTVDEATAEHMRQSMNVTLQKMEEIPRTFEKN